MDLKSFSAVQPAGRTGRGRLICTDADAMVIVAGWRRSVSRKNYLVAHGSGS